MHPITSILRARGGVAGWVELNAAVPAHVVKHAIHAGHIVRLLPRVYTLPTLRSDRMVRLRAALLFAGEGSCLSHITALAQWPRMHVATDEVVHVVAASGRQPRSTGYVRVHRAPARIPAEFIVRRGGLPAIAPAPALIDSWAMLPPSRRRAPVIDAVRLGLVLPEQLNRLVALRGRLRGREELRRLIGLLQAGCRSELELMGFLDVFADRRLPRAHLQYEVVVQGRRYVLDVAWPDLLLAVEMDGAAYHGSNDARERDVRRDSALAQMGWLTIRLTYERLVQDPAGIIDELLGIVGVRRSQLAR